MSNNVIKAVNALKKGKMVIIVDDYERENEGDLVVAAQFVNKEILNFFIKEAKGLMCVPITKEKAEQLQLPYMTQNTDKFQTPFTVSVDAKDVATGISVEDRLKTIRVILSNKSKPSDLLRPGHLFPLVAKNGGVLERAGHTEASIDLLKIARLNPVAVIAEIMNEDGSMARIKELKKFATRFNLPIVSVKEIIEYKLEKGLIVERTASAFLPTKFGNFNLYAYTDIVNNDHYIVLVKGKIKTSDVVPVRVHSACLTGDVFSSLRCDCRQQLEFSLNYIAKSKSGVLLYIPSHEGRGIGIVNKIKAYALQDKGKDTVDANISLGFAADLRDYGIGAQILRDLGLRKIKLLTNNPRKIIGLSAYGLKIVGIIPIKVKPNKYNKKYLKSKKERLFHCC
ncbi:MAG: 3,4-dihydroxy-2-butanone-4-phosphate synthase [Candidatus Diapherotrites archaeon]|nr:3,4-dihydroxy-2-butanone-4-phosphate synthase [Candidatus Diapherotrites archaeon]